MWMYFCSAPNPFGCHPEDEELGAANLCLRLPTKFADIVPEKYVSFYYIFLRFFYFLISFQCRYQQNIHKKWEFIQPEFNQGNIDYDSVVTKLDKMAGTLYRQSVEEKTIFFSAADLRKNEISVESHSQKVGELVLTNGAYHQGYGMVCYFIFLSLTMLIITIAYRVPV